MIYKAYELNAMLKYLILSPSSEKEIEFIGKQEDWDLVKQEVNYHRQNEKNN